MRQRLLLNAILILLLAFNSASPILDALLSYYSEHHVDLDNVDFDDERNKILDISEIRNNMEITTLVEKMEYFRSTVVIENLIGISNSEYLIALSTGNKDLDEIIHIAYFHLENGGAELANFMFDQVILTSIDPPKLCAAYLGVSIGYMEMSQYHHALSYIDFGIIQCRYSQFYMTKSEILSLMSNHRYAIVAINQAINLGQLSDSDVLDALYDKGKELYNMKLTLIAKENFLNLKQHYDDNYDFSDADVPLIVKERYLCILRYIGMCNIEFGDYIEALVSYNQILEIDYKWTHAHFDIGKIFIYVILLLLMTLCN
jgi:tetratricopeptide (TPR) repeat protein